MTSITINFEDLKKKKVIHLDMQIFGVKDIKYIAF